MHIITLLKDVNDPDIAAVRAGLDVIARLKHVCMIAAVIPHRHERGARIAFGKAAAAIGQFFIDAVFKQLHSQFCEFVVESPELMLPLSFSSNNSDLIFFFKTDQERFRFNQPFRIGLSQNRNTAAVTMADQPAVYFSSQLNDLSPGRSLVFGRRL